MSELLAVVATIFGIVTALGFLFQTRKIIQMHDSHEIALPTYLLLLINSIFWLLYGNSINNLPLIISSSVGTLTTLSVLAAYFVYREKSKKVK